ncbi:MAG: glutathione S-transferase family protein [Rubellimicrobium sp.]|nr:glutathione S-transferase family protein [Rubellimicrobium sp.]
MILHDYVLSASCYKVRLLAALLGVPLELKAVNFHPGHEHRSPEMLALNPAGTIPVLVDGDLVLTQSSAMLTYLAAAHGPDWLGQDDPRMAAEVQEWLTFAGALNGSLGLARLHDVIGWPADIHAARAAGIRDLRILEARLHDRRIDGQCFLATPRPTIADIACFPNVALAPDGGISLDPYPAIRLWMRALRALPGFIEMPGIHRLHELAPIPEVPA